MSAAPGRFPSAAILLAGGAARRMGGHPKLLLSIDGESLLQRAIRLARAVQAAPILVVLGGHAESYRAHLADADSAPDVELIDNPQWAEGLGASLRCGVAALPRTGRRKPPFSSSPLTNRWFPSRSFTGFRTLSGTIPKPRRPPATMPGRPACRYSSGTSGVTGCLEHTATSAPDATCRNTATR
jgi:hypothetical protein